MPNQLGSYLPPPTKQRFADTFRTVSQFSFWIQLVLGAISVITLLLAIFRRNLSVQTNNAGIGLGIFLARVGILLLCFRVYWAFRYRRLAKRLQSYNRELHRRKEDIIQVLQIGRIVSFLGVLLAFLGSEISVVVVLAKALSEPQVIAVYNRQNVIYSLDIFVVLANINMINTHFVGGVTSLGLIE